MGFSLHKTPPNSPYSKKECVLILLGVLSIYPHTFSLSFLQFFLSTLFLTKSQALNFKCWLLPKVIVTYFGIIASKCCHKRIYKYCHYHHCNGMYTNTLEEIEPSNSGKLSLEFPLRPPYTRSQGQKTVGPTLSIFGLQIRPKLLIHSRTMTSGY